MPPSSDHCSQAWNPAMKHQMQKTPMLGHCKEGKMDKKKINAFLIQEMHLEGDYMKQLPGGKILIHHGPETQPKQGAKGRVAII